MELATLYVVYIRLGAARVRLLPARNRQNAAARGFCAAMGALGFVKLRRKYSHNGTRIRYPVT
jgi:hypothetical protein